MADDIKTKLSGTSRIEEAIARREKAESSLKQSYKAPEAAIERLNREVEKKERQLKALVLTKADLINKKQEKEIAVLDAQIRQVSDEISQYRSGGSMIGVELHKAQVASQAERMAKVFTSESGFYRSIESSLGVKQTSSDVAQARRFESTRQRAVSVGLSPTASTFDMRRDVEYKKALLETAAQRIKSSATAVATANILSEKEKSGVITPEEQDRLQAARQEAGMFSTRVAGRNRLVQSLAQSEEAIGYRKRFGLDVESRFSKAQGVASRIEDIAESNLIKKEVGQGAYSREQIEKDLAQTGKQLLDTFAKLRDAFEKGSSNADALASEFEDLQKQYNKQEKISREIDRQPAQDINRLGFIGRQIGGFGSALSAVGAAYSYENVGAQQALMGNRIGAAQRTNQINRDIIAGAGGDYAAIRRFITDQARMEADYATQIRGKARLGEGIQLTGSGAQTAAAGIGAAQNFMTAVGAGTAIGGPAGAAKALLANLGSTAGEVAGPAAQFATQLSDFRYQNRSMSAGLYSAQQMRQYFDTVNELGDSMGQQGLDFITQSAKRLVGIGGTKSARPMRAAPATLAESMRRNPYAVSMQTSESFNVANPFQDMSSPQAVLENLGNSFESLTNAVPEASRRAKGQSLGVVNPLAAVDTMPVAPPTQDLADMLIEATSGDKLKALLEESGVTESRVAKAQQAAVQLGSSFFGTRNMTNEAKRDSYLSNLRNVSSLEAAGIVGQEKFYGMQSRLIQAGAGQSAKGIEDIMRTAIAAGFTDSRSFEKLVDLTAQVAQNTKDTAMGIDVTGGAASLIGGMVQSQDESKTIEQALAAAGSTANVLRSTMTSQDLSLGNVMEMDLLSRAVPKASMSQVQLLQKMGPEALAEMNKQFAAGTGEDFIRKNYPGLEGIVTSAQQAQQISRIGIGTSLLNTPAVYTAPSLIKKVQGFMETGNMPKFDKDELAALQVAGYSPNTLEGAIKGTLRPQDIKKGEYDLRRGSAQDTALAREYSATMTTAEGTGKVMPEIEAFTTVIKSMGRMISKEGFVGAAEAAADELKISSNEHVKAVQAMTSAMLEAAQKIGVIGGGAQNNNQQFTPPPNSPVGQLLDSLWNNSTVHNKLGWRR